MKNNKIEKKKISHKISSQETLKEIVESFKKIENNNKIIKKKNNLLLNSFEEIENNKIITCIICKNKIDKGNIALSLLCCGESVHVQCLSKEKQNPSYNCPNCNSKIKNEQILLCYHLSNHL